ncbi:MAG: hypothetical protein A2Y67_01280 [Candidatus Buchananbacteria bacterium RBG_13_39_9]|uniref:Uncharacterized protein n=1 Tax=Candidatus Buchananbacteria bacterium RBG_13_39_9 TaxID=1797531 RepID=A0A1G1XN09_9BACT|nr:MAG: hypothetical protein A2Y67_01280 [Candidatus Buchananbacteria bacterium RBG_13_39_9]
MTESYKRYWIKRFIFCWKFGKIIIPTKLRIRLQIIQNYFWKWRFGEWFKKHLPGKILPQSADNT